MGKGKKVARTAGKKAKAAPARRASKLPAKQKPQKTKKKSVPAKVAAKVKAKVKTKLKKAVSTARTAARKAVPRKAKKAAAAKPAPKPKATRPVAAGREPAKKQASAAIKRTAPVAPASAASPKPASPAPAKAPKARRPRTRIQGGTGIVASWFPSENRPRPSSFIPAPPRAESPSLVAAPPASSDRLIHPADLDGAALSIRLFPVRVDIEQSMGRVQISPRPEFIAIRAGEALEWDFRYLAGTDAMVDEVIIEFDKPAPFAKNVMKSRKPGSALPHRQLSGPAAGSAAGKTFEYRIRCLNIFKTDVAMVRATLVVHS